MSIHWAQWCWQDDVFSRCDHWQVRPTKGTYLLLGANRFVAINLNNLQLTQSQYHQVTYLQCFEP